MVRLDKIIEGLELPGHTPSVIDDIHSLDGLLKDILGRTIIWPDSSGGAQGAHISTSVAEKVAKSLRVLWTNGAKFQNGVYCTNYDTKSNHQLHSMRQALEVIRGGELLTFFEVRLLGTSSTKPFPIRLTFASVR